MATCFSTPGHVLNSRPRVLRFVFETNDQPKRLLFASWTVRYGSRGWGGVFSKVTCSLKRHPPANSTPRVCTLLANLRKISFVSSKTTRRHAWICWSAASESTLSATACQAKSESRGTTSRCVSCFASVLGEMPQAQPGLVLLSSATLCSMLS